MLCKKTNEFPWAKKFFAQGKGKIRLALSAGSRGTTAGAAAGLSQLYTGIKDKAHTVKINCNGLGLLDKILIRDKLKALYIKYLIGVFWLIQSHCKGWAPSSAGVEKNPYGRWGCSFEILIDLRFSKI